MKKALLFLFTVLLCIGVSVKLNSKTLDKYVTMQSEEATEQEVIATQENVKENGYPVNDNGETYGPDCYDEMKEEPDLLLALCDNGTLGYIRQSDMNDNPTTIEQALECNNRQFRVINVYLQDGITCIDQFTTGGNK